MIKIPVYAIFVAGGSGSRMGSATPKQFLELGGIPILQRSVEGFLEACPEAKVIIVLPQRNIGTWKELCLKYAASFPQTLVEGGMTRFHSVLNALGICWNKCVLPAGPTASSRWYRSLIL